jgi:RND family efflux transporter MFP subunit
MYDLQQAKDEYENTVSALAGYQASINQAGAGLDAAEAGYRAAKVAYRAVSGDAREQQEELAKMQIEQAQLNYNSLMEQLGNAVVTAPADGTVLSVNVQVNNYASPSSSTVMLASGQSMKAVFGLPGHYFGQVQVGDTAFVQATGGTATATITEVAPMINPQTGTFSVTAEFVNTAGLLSGSTAKVTLTTQHAEGVLTLPVDCVRFEDNKPYVYVLADGFAKKTYITLGMTDEVVYEVADGLGASDRVISTWHPNLTDGAAVAVQ